MASAYLSEAVDMDAEEPKLRRQLSALTTNRNAEEVLSKFWQLLQRALITLPDAIFIVDADGGEIFDCNPATTEMFGYDRREMLGRTIDFLHAGEATPEEFRKRLHQTPEEQEIPHRFELKMKRKDGAIFLAEHSLTPLEDEQGRRIGWVNVVRDVTGRDRVEDLVARRTTALKEANEQLQRQVSQHKEAEEKRERLLALLRATIESTTEGVIVVDNNERVLVFNRKFEEVWNLPNDWASLDDLTAQVRFLSEQVEHPEEFVRQFEALNTDPESEGSNLINLKSGRILECYYAPYHVGEKITGRVWTFRDVTERSWAEKEEVIAEERRHIAGEVLDSLAQDLAALRLRTRFWHRLVDTNPAQMHFELDQLREILGDNIRQARRSIFALQPPRLDEHGFFPALRQLTADFVKHHQLQVNLQVSGAEEHLPSSLEIIIFRVIQEALNNVGKHARASTVWITLDLESPDVVALTVRDDGLGFDPALLEQAIRYRHFGLKQAQQQVAEAGGSFTIQSRPDGGTEIQVGLPIARPRKFQGNKEVNSWTLEY